MKKSLGLYSKSIYLWFKISITRYLLNIFQYQNKISHIKKITKKYSNSLINKIRNLSFKLFSIFQYFYRNNIYINIFQI